MMALLLLVIIVVAAAITIAVPAGGREPVARQVSRRRRVNGADPYAAHLKPEKLNPGLGGGCASGGGGG